MWPLTWRHPSTGPSQFGTLASPASVTLRRMRVGRRAMRRSSSMRAVGDLDAAVHDDDASGPLLQLGQRVRGQQHRRAAPAQLARRSRRSSGAAPGRGRWSARRAAGRAARRAAPGPGRDAGACPWSRCRRAGRRRGPRPTRSSSARDCRCRLALQAGVEAQRLAPGQGGVEGDVLRQVAEPPARGELARGRVLAQHRDAARASGGSGPSISFISVVLPAPLWPTSATVSPSRQGRRRRRAPPRPCRNA